MNACELCRTTADVWECAAGTFCRLHLPLDAGCLWRIDETTYELDSPRGVTR